MSSDEQAIRLMLFRYVLWGHVIFGLLFAVIGSFWANVGLRYWLMGVGFMLSGLVGFLLDHWKNTKIAQMALLGAGFAIITAAVATGGGIQSLAFWDYIGLALMAGVIYGELASLSVVFVSLLVGLGFVIVENKLGGWPLFVRHTPFSIWFSYLFILPMVFAFQYLLTYGLRRAIRQAGEEIAQRKRAEEHFRQLFDATPNALILVNRHGMIEMCNHSTEKLFDYSMAELIGHPVEILVPEDLQANHFNNKRKFLEHPTPRAIGTGNELEGVHRSGRRISLEVGLNPLETVDGVKILVSILDITERKHEEKTRQHLLDISQTAVAATSPTEILENTMKIIRESLAFDYLGLRWVEAVTGELRYVTSMGKYASTQTEIANWVIQTGYGIAGMVARTGIPECVNNSHLDSRTIYPPGVAIAKEHSICLPLIAEGRVFGILFIARYEDPPFTSEEFELAKLYLNHITLAIYNAQLRQVDQTRLQELEELNQELQSQKGKLEERVQARTVELHKEILERKQVVETLRHRSELLTTLHNISLDLFNHRELDEVLKTILARATQLLNAPFGYISIIEGERLIDWATIPDDDQYEKLNRKISDTPLLLRTAIEQKKSFQIDDYSLQPGLRPRTVALGLRAAILVPILAGEKVFGLLGIFHGIPERKFSDEERQTLELFAQIAALALDNAHLYAQEQHEFMERKRTEEILRQHVKLLSLMHSITLDLLQQRDIETLQQMIVEQMALFLEVDWGVLTLKEGDLLIDRAILSSPDHPYQMVTSSREDDPTSPIWQVIDKAHPFVTENYTALVNIRPETASLGLKATILLPVFIGNTCQGILGTGRINSSSPFDEEEIRYGMLLARIAGIILENALLHETLRQEAIRDPLTNLFNRRFMEESLTRELQRAARLNHSLVVVMLDIDHFKIFNDTYGHSAGDEVLRCLADVLKENFRNSDIACRYGGEEFILILPDVTYDDAFHRMEELRKEISRLVVIYQEISLPAITISIGLASFPMHASSGNQLLLKADEALYRAKNAGRNRVIGFS